jgi:Fur family ferric uptake transcriptional regulator
MRNSEYNTETKHDVLEILKQKQETALSVHDIMADLKALNNTANITTVYRILEKLEHEQRVIKHTAEDGKKALFQYILPESGCMHHLHVQCTSCGKIIHLDCKIIEDAIQHISEAHGMQIVCSASLLYGICSECRKKMGTTDPTAPDANKTT